MGPADYRVKRGSEEVGNVPDAFSEAHELPVEKAWLRSPPEQIAGMAIVVHECLRRIGKEMHHLVPLARIAHGLRMKG